MSEEAVQDPPMTMAGNLKELFSDMNEDKSPEETLDVVPEENPESKSVDDPVKEEENKEDAKDPISEETETTDDSASFGFESDDTDEQEETEEEEEIEAPEGLEGKERDAFIKQRQKIKELNEKLKEKENTPTEASLTPEIQLKIQEAEKAEAKVRQLEDRVKDLTEKDYVAQLQETPEYRASVTSPIENISEQVEAIAEDFGKSAEDIATAIQETRVKNQEDLLKNLKLSPLSLQKVIQLSNRYHEVQAVRKEMMSNAEVKNVELQAQRDKEALEKENEFSSSLKDQTDHWVGEVRKANEHLFDGDYKDKISKSLSQAAKVDLRKETPRNQAYARVAGAVLPTVLSENKALRSRLAELEGKNKSPSLKDSTSIDSNNGDEAPQSFMDLARKTFQK